MESDDDIIEKYRNITTKTFMTMDEALALSRRIAEDHAGAGIDLVIGVPNGALLVADVVASSLGVPRRFITVRRKGSAIKQRLARHGWIKRLAAAWYQIPVLRFPLYLAMQRMSALADDAPPEDLSLAGFSRILIVDDSLETGQSLARVLEIVRAQAPQAEVSSAVISVGQAVPEAQRHVHPDYFISPLMQHFPWSSNSPEYEAYQAWLAEHDLLQHWV